MSQSGSYHPQPRVAKIIDAAYAIVQSVEYEVSLRWVFYQLLQRYGLSKDAYRQIKAWLSKARKSYYKGWTPDTLADDTRAISFRDTGHADAEKWMRSLIKKQAYFDVASEQQNILLVLFEAAAMESQFDHYLAPLRVTTAPFHGDASIPLKSKIAKRITAIHERYPTKPIRVLYFGDYDPKGLSIPVSALRDIWQWCRITQEGGGAARQVAAALRVIHPGEKWTGTSVYTRLAPSPDDPNILQRADGFFQWIRVGINEDQVATLDIPENPEKPGTYQWEALSDDQAGRMIHDAVSKYWDEGVIHAALKRETEAEKIWAGEITKLVERLYPIKQPSKRRKP